MDTPTRPMTQKQPAVRPPAEAEALARQWLGLVGYCFKRLCLRRPEARRHRDACFSVGYEALHRAAQYWRTDGGAKFSTYGVRCILPHMGQALTHLRQFAPVFDGQYAFSPGFFGGGTAGRKNIVPRSCGSHRVCS